MNFFDFLVKIAIFGAFLFRSRDFYEKLSTRACLFNDSMNFKQFHFFKHDLQKGQNFYKKMHDLGIIQNIQQYPKLLRISWRNCL